MPLGKIVILLGWRVQRPFRGFVVDALWWMLLKTLQITLFCVLASLEGDSPRGGEMSRNDRGDTAPYKQFYCFLYNF